MIGLHGKHYYRGRRLSDAVRGRLRCDRRLDAALGVGAGRARGRGIRGRLVFLPFSLPVSLRDRMLAYSQR